jgi:hypothetical protein
MKRESDNKLVGDMIKELVQQSDFGYKGTKFFGG